MHMNKKILSLIVVIIAGEAIFMLPFLIPRLYRSLMMDAWSINNTTVGLAFSAYGITAMISYIIGGPFADKFEPRLLMVISLVVTALGSALLIYFPSPTMLIVTYGFFGVSTIFLMWSAMIKVTHEIGGEKHRATSMGFLDGGRGFVAAIMSSFLVIMVSMQSTSDGLIEDKTYTLNSIYFYISAFMIISAIIVWFTLKDVETQESKKHDWSLDKAIILSKDLNLWLLAIIILSAYCSYKNVGNFPVYLNDVKKVSIQKSSLFTSYVFWLRPIAAFLTGIFADRLTLKVKGGRFITLILCFILGALSQLLLTFDILSTYTMITSTILFTAAFAYALRAIYFSVFGEFKINDNIIGTAVGIVSLVGYLPDFFFGLFTGYLIDTYPGKLGFTYVFSFNAAFLLLGAIASYISYRRVIRK